MLPPLLDTNIRLDISIFCRRWANGGFLFNMVQAIIEDLGKLSEKLFIMICLRIIFQ